MAMTIICVAYGWLSAGPPCLMEVLHWAQIAHSIINLFIHYCSINMDAYILSCIERRKRFFLGHLGPDPQLVKNSAVQHLTKGRLLYNIPCSMHAMLHIDIISGTILCHH